MATTHPSSGEPQTIQETEPQDATVPKDERKSKPGAAWFTVYAKALIAIILALSLVGGYSALSIPIAVFPTTDFPGF